MSENNNVLGNNIKYLRETYGLTLNKLASVLNFEKTTIYRYEKGREPDINTIQKIANYFNVPIDDLLKTDLSQYELKEFSDNIVTVFNSPNDLWGMIISLMDIVPLCSSEEAEKNGNFKKGYILSQEFKDFFYNIQQNIEKNLSLFSLYNDLQNDPKIFHQIKKLCSDEKILEENIQNNTKELEQIEQYITKIFHENSLNMDEIFDQIDKIDHQLNTKYS